MYIPTNNLSFGNLLDNPIGIEVFFIVLEGHLGFVYKAKNKIKINLITMINTNDA